MGGDHVDLSLVAEGPGEEVPCLVGGLGGQPAIAGNLARYAEGDVIGSGNWTVIEDVAGLRPRSDAKVELSPIDIGWSHFTVNNLRYRNGDLSIVWDDPADGVVRYPGVPEGYSIFVNGNRVATGTTLSAPSGE